MERKVVSVYDAKTHLSRFCGVAASGQDVVITRHGQPWVRITTLGETSGPRPGLGSQEFKIPDDFDAPCPEVLDMFGL